MARYSLEISASEAQVQGPGLGVSGQGLRVQGLGLEVKG